MYIDQNKQQCQYVTSYVCVGTAVKLRTPALMRKTVLTGISILEPLSLLPDARLVPYGQVVSGVTLECRNELI